MNFLTPKPLFAFFFFDPAQGGRIRKVGQLLTYSPIPLVGLGDGNSTPSKG